MTIHVTVVHDLDHETAARVLVLDPPQRPTPRAVRQTIAALLAEHGTRGARREYLRLRRLAADDGTSDAHDRDLARCRDLVAAAYPPPRPRPPKPRPAPVGQPLITVLADDL